MVIFWRKRMGSINKLFGQPKPDYIEILDTSIEKLRLGVFAHLFSKYLKELDAAQAKFLAASVLNEIVVEKPSNLDAEHYYAANLNMIYQESLKLSQNEILSEALSYLYAAQILFLVHLTKQPISERSMLLTERATELSIYIPSTYDICGTDDAKQCTLYIAKFADEFFQEASKLVQ
jgi:hypothetical protein